MFSFGNANVTGMICDGKECCKDGKCICACEISPGDNGKCKITPKRGYHLYRLVDTDNEGKKYASKMYI